MFKLLRLLTLSFALILTTGITTVATSNTAEASSYNRYDYLRALGYGAKKYYRYSKKYNRYRYRQHRSYNKNRYYSYRNQNHSRYYNYNGYRYKRY